MEFLKAEVVKSGHYRVKAIPFYGPLKGRDLDGQFFSERTDTKPDWFPQGPVLWHHGLDRSMDADSVKVGMRDTIKREGDGWWGEVWLDKQNRYFAQIDAMINAGRMYGSSGTMPNLVKAGANGELLVWPHIEQTLSPVPRNPYSIVRATKALSDFEEAGLWDLARKLEELSSDLRQETSATGEAVAAKAFDEALMRELETLETALQVAEEIHGRSQSRSPS